MAKKKVDLAALKDIPPWDWPRDTGKMLLGLLRDDKTPDGDRLLAVDLAGDSTVIDDELAEALIAHVRDDRRTEEIRAAAALSLGPALEQADLLGFDDADDVPITEETFQKLQSALREVFSNAGLPSELRRRVLEASVRAPQDWHVDVIHTAYAERDGSWRLTAVFCMRYVRGFDEQILAALDDPDPAIRCEAVLAAGEWGLEAAWPHVKALVTSKKTEKPLLVAAIEAVASIRPSEAPQVLAHLADSDDEDIAGAVAEALDMADVGPFDEDEMFPDDDPDEDDDDDEDEPDRRLLN